MLQPPRLTARVALIIVTSILASFLIGSVRADPTTTPTIAGGGLFTLFLKNDGNLWTVGANGSGQLGDGTTMRQPLPKQLVGNVAQVVAGFAHTLFIKGDGSLWGTGDNFYGELGDYNSQHPTPVQITTAVKSVTAGEFYTLFVKQDGTLWAMGDNFYGQLGDGSGINQHVPIQVTSGVQAVAAGQYHSLFVKTDGTLWAMGDNSYGQLGDGTNTERDTPVQIASSVQKAAAGFNFSLFLKTNGTLWAMGHNAYGQLGDGTLLSRSTPVQVATGVQDISCGSYHTLILKTGGSLVGTGWNTNGQLAVTDPPTSNGYHPNAVSIATNVGAIAAGDLHTLYVTADGRLFAVGADGSCQLGDGGMTDRYTPVLVASGVSTPTPSPAPPVTVTSGNDSGPGTLRQAILDASSGDTINFAAGITTINLTSGELLIDKNLTINGPGANLLTVQRSSAGSFRIFHIAPASITATISGLKIANGVNPSQQVGGGILNIGALTITNCTISGNRSTNTFGGGISNAGLLTITNSTISGNSGANQGGGVESGGSVTITNSTISANSAGVDGGGIFNRGGTVTITNSTISGNIVGGGPGGGGASGGGIRNFTGGIVTITNSTISGNTAAGSGGGFGGGIRNVNGGTVTSKNSIIALNTSDSGPNFDGPLTSQGFNLIGNNTGATITPAQSSDQIGTAASPKDPLLGSLQNNGGTTETHALLVNSTAIDKGHSSGSTTDQRGFTRPVGIANVSGGDGSDIGAFEVQPPAPTIQFSAANYDVGEGDGHATITVTRGGDTSGTSTVDFATSNGTASQRTDYLVRNGTLTFAPGITSKTFFVPIIDDVYPEVSETVNLTLSNVVGAVLAAPSTATITIVDNDAAGPSIAQKRFGASFGGAEETPANASLGSGQGYVLLNAAETSANVSLQFINLGSAETAAHIHGPVPAGTPGPIIFPLPTTNPVTDFQISPIPQQVTDLKAGLHYINVHSSNFPNGEIRGQLFWNPIMEDAFFVRQHYLDFLGREPDAAGLTFWVNRFNENCVSGVQCFHNNTIGVSDAFFFEPEFHQTAGFVFLVYRAAYGNTQPFHNPDGSNPAEANKLPDYATFTADRARVVGGANLSASQLAFANLFVTRAEFTNKYGAGLNTGPLFVDAVLATIQADDGVDLTSQRQALIDQYNTAGGGNGGRAQVLNLLSLDDALNNPINNRAFVNAEYNRQFALTLYFGYLRRNPDMVGFLFWQGQINLAAVGDVPKQQALVCSFVTAPEYELRFGPNAPRNNRECPQ